MTKQDIEMFSSSNFIGKVLLLFVLPSCGSLYNHQSVDLIIDTWESGGPGGATCLDKATSCNPYHYSEMTNDGVITIISGCRTSGSSNSSAASKDFFCKVYSQQSTTLSAAALTAVKQTVVDAQPSSLADAYYCMDNDSCSSDPTTLSITITIDGVAKQIFYSDGGPEASLRMSDILKATNQIGL